MSPGSTNSNEAFTISLVRDGRKAEAASFNPEFTYPIFGEQEVIFGYRGLKIDLAFAAHNLQPHLQIKWNKQFPGIGDVKPTDVHAALQGFLPSSAFTDDPRSAILSRSITAGWTPPGELVEEYKIGDDAYELYEAPLDNPRAREILENMQILVPLFIEGGSALELDQEWTTERWKLYLLYQVHTGVDASRETPYSLIGYSTAYRVFTLPSRDMPLEDWIDLPQPRNWDLGSILWAQPENPPPSFKSPLSLPCRERLSQFLILPPYQGSGHGARLYNAMFSRLTAPSNVLEFTVEDPNEAFDDMRDVCDLTYLRATNPDFASLSINTNIPAAQLRRSEPIPSSAIVNEETKSRVRLASKIMPRQLARLVEMQTLSRIPRLHRSTSRITRKEKSTNEHDRAYYFWRLYVKQRLYDTNRDTLNQLDHEERVEKLEATAENVKLDYERLFEMAERRERSSAAQKGKGKETTKETRRSKAKRVVVEDEDEDEEWETEDGAQDSDGEEAKRAGKRRKIA